MMEDQGGEMCRQGPLIEQRRGEMIEIDEITIRLTDGESITLYPASERAVLSNFLRTDSVTIPELLKYLETMPDPKPATVWINGCCDQVVIDAKEKGLRQVFPASPKQEGR